MVTISSAVLPNPVSLRLVRRNDYGDGVMVVRWLFGVAALLVCSLAMYGLWWAQAAHEVDALSN